MRETEKTQRCKPAHFFFTTEIIKLQQDVGSGHKKKKTTAKQVEAACNEATGPNISQPNVAVKL